jgi:hypothetical protein
MMLFDPAVAMQPLLDVVHQARTELRIQAETLPSSLHPALRQASQRGVRVRYLLGPQAAYTLDAQGQPMLPKRPFEQGPQGADIDFAGATGDLLINPNFSELGPKGQFRPGVRSHAFYLTAGDSAALCTGSPVLKVRPLCVTGDAPVARALAALFDSEFLDTLAGAERAALAAQARRVIVVGPDDNAPLLELLSVPGAVVLTSGLDQGKAFAQLTRGERKTLVIPVGIARLPAIEAARKAGVKVVTREGGFEGTVVWTPGRAFMGSQRLTDAALERDRDVGVILQGEGADALRKFIEGRS